jgi:hypothetical protein
MSEKTCHLLSLSSMPKDILFTAFLPIFLYHSPEKREARRSKPE